MLPPILRTDLPDGLWFHPNEPGSFRSQRAPCMGLLQLRGPRKDLVIVRWFLSPSVGTLASLGSNSAWETRESLDGIELRSVNERHRSAFPRQ
jgi:hypothetical protein